MDRKNLDVFMPAPPVRLLVFDSEIGEMYLVFEVRKVVFGSPAANLLVGPIVVAVVVVAVAVVLVQPLLIVALQLVVENDSVDARAAIMEPLGGFQVGAEDLRVVFQFASPFQTGIEGLGGVAVIVSMTVKKVAAFLRQHHNGAAMAGHADRLDQALFAQVPKIRRSIARGCVIVVTELTSGHYSERADSG
jgi:hypothetical protein